MDRVELMKVDDVFMIERIGLVVSPSFDLPVAGGRVNINETVMIKTPDGKEVLVEALFSVAHLKIHDPSVSVKKRWPVFVSLKGVAKENVPVGSSVYVSQSTKRILTAGAV